MESTSTLAAQTCMKVSGRVERVLGWVTFWWIPYMHLHMPYFDKYVISHITHVLIIHPREF